jgi:hypothetical protein
VGVVVGVVGVSRTCSTKDRVDVDSTKDRVVDSTKTPLSYSVCSHNQCRHKNAADVAQESDWASHLVDDSGAERYSRDLVPDEVQHAHEPRAQLLLRPHGGRCLSCCNHCNIEKGVVVAAVVAAVVASSCSLLTPIQKDSFNQVDLSLYF